MASKKDLLEADEISGISFGMMQSDGTQIPTEIADKLNQLAEKITDGDYIDEMNAYKGSFGNFFAEK